MNQRIPSPDCRDGKHTACAGDGWDVDADTAVRCPCDCHDTTAMHSLGLTEWDCPRCGQDPEDCYCDG